MSMDKYYPADDAGTERDNIQYKHGKTPYYYFMSPDGKKALSNNQGKPSTDKSSWIEYDRGHAAYIDIAGNISHSRAKGQYAGEEFMRKLVQKGWSMKLGGYR